MEGQRHNNPLTRVAFVYNGPEGMELAPSPRYRNHLDHILDPVSGLWLMSCFVFGGGIRALRSAFSYFK